MSSHTQTPTTLTAPQAPGQVPGLQVKTQVKAGGLTVNHNETLVRPPRPAAGLQVKTHLKAGSFPPGPSRS